MTKTAPISRGTGKSREVQQPLRVQLAFQGGGARVVSLLAAAEAVEELVERGEIEVTRVAGTSAGAIVACLFASSMKIRDVRSKLLQKTQDDWRKLLPRRSIIGSLFRIARGRPVWGANPIREMLREFFDRRGEHTFSELRIETLVVATDLTTGDRVVYGNDRKESVVEALLDSIAIPFVFRTWSVGGTRTVVDGGICENLPSSVLQSDTKQYGEVIGLSLPSKDSLSPEGLFSFGRSLIDVALNNSVNRARESLEGRICPIATDLNTLDFNRALTEGLRDEVYLDVKRQTSAWFEDLVEAKRGGNSQIMIGDPWRFGDQKTMRTLSSVYTRTAARGRLKYELAVFEIEAHSLNQQGPGIPPFDKVRHIVEFSANSEPVYCHSMSLLLQDDSEFLGRAVWKVTDADGKPLDAEMLPVIDPERPHSRQLLFFFDPPLTPGSTRAPYRIELEDYIRHAFPDLRKDGKDTIGLTPSRTDGQTEVCLVVHLPSSCADIDWHAAEGGVQQIEELSGRDLAAFRAPYDYVSVGWRGTASGEQRMGVDFALAGP